MITRESSELLRLYPHWRHGVLPRGGGLMDQPNGVVAAMTVIAGVQARAARRGDD